MPLHKALSVLLWRLTTALLPTIYAAILVFCGLYSAISHDVF